MPKFVTIGDVYKSWVKLGKAANHYLAITKLCPFTEDELMPCKVRSTEVSLWLALYDVYGVSCSVLGPPNL